jgi:hypothetical protein
MAKFLDPTERLKLHIEYSRKRDQCAQRGLDMSEAGKRDEAIEALEEAEYWELKAKSLEP